MKCKKKLKKLDLDAYTMLIKTNNLNFESKLSK